MGSASEVQWSAPRKSSGSKKYIFYFPTLFLTPFCNLKLYFCVKAFYTHILIKTPKIKNPVESPSKVQWVKKYFVIFQFCFWLLFVTSNCIFVFLKHFIHKSLSKHLKLKVQWRAQRKSCGVRLESPVESASKVLWRTPRKSSGSKNIFYFPILFLTPFCNLKLYFCVFKAFYTQILIKTPKIKSPVESATKVQWEAPLKSSGPRLESPVVQKIYSIFRLCFWPLFVTFNCILC